MDFMVRKLVQRVPRSSNIEELASDPDNIRIIIQRSRRTRIRRRGTCRSLPGAIPIRTIRRRTTIPISISRIHRVIGAGGGIRRRRRSKRKRREIDVRGGFLLDLLYGTTASAREDAMQFEVYIDLFRVQPALLLLLSCRDRFETPHCVSS